MCLIPLLLASASGLVVNLKPTSVALRSKSRMSADAPRERLLQEADEVAVKVEPVVVDLVGTHAWLNLNLALGVVVAAAEAGAAAVARGQLGRHQEEFVLRVAQAAGQLKVPSWCCHRLLRRPTGAMPTRRGAPHSRHEPMSRSVSSVRLRCGREAGRHRR